MKKNEIYPMSMLREKLSEEQIAKFSEKYEFNESDKYFHCSVEDEFLESLNEDEIAYFNEGMSESQKLRFAA